MFKNKRLSWLFFPFLLIGLSGCSQQTSTTNLKTLSQLQRLAENHAELTTNKKQLIETLKDVYIQDPKAGLNLLFNSWQYTLLDQKILERFNQDINRSVRAFGSNRSIADVKPNATLKGLHLKDHIGDAQAMLAETVVTFKTQKVIKFDYKATSSSDFEVKVQIDADGQIDTSKASSYIGTIFKDDASKKEVEEELKKPNHQEKITAIFTYTPESQGLFKASSFSVATGNITLNTKLTINVSSNTPLFKKLLENSLTSKLKHGEFKDERIDLYPFVLYSIL